MLKNVSSCQKGKFFKEKEILKLKFTLLPLIRFFTIPAQALRCVLDGVSGVLYGMKETWPHQTLECVRGCKDKKAVIFVEDFFKGALVGSKKQQTMVVAM